MGIRLLKHHQFLFSIFLLWALLSNANTFAQSWESEFYREHILVGKIWDTEKNSWITEKQLFQELIEYDYILLGETHNNIDHHALQARVIDFLAANGRRPTIVMEMLAQESWVKQPSTWDDLAILQNQARLLNKGWPWELYIPVLESIVSHQLELVAGNIKSEDLHQWSNNIGSYTPEEVITEYWITPANFKQLKQDIVDSHCGHANEAFVNFMSRAQLQRDRIMTTSLIESKIPVVLIAGAGHVRNDYAIPMHLQNTHQQLSFISIAFISVDPELSKPIDYLDDSPNKFDILYFTPSHTNQDPCVKFRKQLKNLRDKSIR